jgi:hypothetical protein
MAHFGAPLRIDIFIMAHFGAPLWIDIFIMAHTSSATTGCRYESMILYCILHKMMIEFDWFIK